MEVPDRYSPSRPAGRRAGLTLHRLEGGAYRTAPQSGAFPGWTAEAIHTALNEPSLSAATGRVLDRVGRTLGARDVTGIAPEEVRRPPALRGPHSPPRPYQRKTPRSISPY